MESLERKIDQLVREIKESREKTDADIRTICMGQQKLFSELGELRRNVFPLSKLPLEVAVNRQAIIRLDDEHKGAKRLFWKLIIGTMTALTGAVITVTVKIWQ